MIPFVIESIIMLSIDWNSFSSTMFFYLWWILSFLKIKIREMLIYFGSRMKNIWKCISRFNDSSTEYHLLPHSDEELHRCLSDGHPWLLNFFVS